MSSARPICLQFWFTGSDYRSGGIVRHERFHPVKARLDDILTHLVSEEIATRWNVECCQNVGLFFEPLKPSDVLVSIAPSSRSIISPHTGQEADSDDL